ncbi:MASE4 domain-containing protein [Bradyrhizobium liaoningense]|uniref:MASE4 domain-containing protein n=1 Tax=Bradyrhizobium liaoningense TaxID=43992 RepID=UPI002011EB79|nr:MASE4 domain-containing protein [Bradyrhizobium liaoningense]
MFMERSAAGLQAHEHVLSNLSPSVAQRRFALGVVLVLLLVFVIVAGPLSGLPLRRVDAFIPAYGTAIFVIDSITAALLFAQFSVLRSHALLALANGYFLTALIAIPWTLTFPGVLAPEGGLGGGLQSTVWLYVLSHVGFALFAIVYILLKDADPMEWLSSRSIRARILAALGSVTALVCCATVFVTAGHALLPRIMLDTAEVSYLWYYAIGPMAALFVVALVLLWLRHRSVLDLWLMLVLFAYIIEIALTAFPMPYRFSVGWYAGRIYGVLSGSFVLLILMKEVTMLYGELLRAVLAQRREREVRLLTGDAVAATVAHEIKQPLSAMIMNASTSLRWLDRATPNIDEAKAALQAIVNNGHRADAVIENIRTLFKRDARTRTLLDVNNLIREALALVRDDLQTHRVAVQTDYNQSLPPIEGNQVQLQQVLVNLITNAIDSMATEVGDRVLSLRSKVYDSGSLMVSVEDVGKGVEPSATDLIFKPQFTTKVHGMGMGLSICRSIIEAHGGQLWVTANLPRGAIFQFTLPAHQEHYHAQCSS